MKANTRTLVLIFAVILLMFLAVMILKPKHGPEVVTNGIQVYFLRSRGADSVLEAVTRPLPTERGDGALVNAAVTDLLKGPSENERIVGLFSEIPAGTKINSVKELPDRVIVDLTAEYTTGGGSNSVVQRYDELAKTLKALPIKKPVYITVAGKPLDILGGEGLEIPRPITGKSGS